MPSGRGAHYTYIIWIQIPYKKKCDEATEKEMEVNEIAALQDFDKIQLSKIIEKVFIYEPGRMEISWKMDDIFYKEEKA
mgnify:CR=1 FL=1